MLLLSSDNVNDYVTHIYSKCVDLAGNYKLADTGEKLHNASDETNLTVKIYGCKS